MKTLKKILALAIPSSIGFLVLILFENVNIFWLGHYSSEAVAAVGAASFFEWILFSLMNMTTIGLASMVSERLGAKDHKTAHDLIRQSWQLSMLVSVGLMLFFLPLLKTFFSWAGLSGTTLQMAYDYLSLMIWFLPLVYTLQLQTHIFNCYKDSKTATCILAFTVALNMLLDPFLILGWWGGPHLGTAGGAIASLISQAVGISIRLYLLRKKKYIPAFKEFLVLKSSSWRSLLSIGLPSALTNATWMMVFPILTSIITTFGVLPLAGLAIGGRIEAFPFYISTGLGWAVGVLVGHARGENNPVLADQYVRTGLWAVSAILLPVSFAFVFFPDLLAALINSDPLVQKEAASYLRIIGYFELFLGWELLFEGAFNGLGQSKTYMYVRVPLTFLRVPCAFLAKYLGAPLESIWWILTLSTFFKGIVLFVVYFWGGWSPKESLSEQEAPAPLGV